MERIGPQCERCSFAHLCPRELKRGAESQECVSAFARSKEERRPIPRQKKKAFPPPPQSSPKPRRARAPADDDVAPSPTGRATWQQPEANSCGRRGGLSRTSRPGSVADDVEGHRAVGVLIDRRQLGSASDGDRKAFSSVVNEGPAAPFQNPHVRAALISCTFTHSLPVMSTRDNTAPTRTHARSCC